MTDLPEPLTPADCDLRDFPFMPLEIGRLRRSKAWLAAKRNPALGFYMLNLWSASWHDVPAASLEDDDDVLADLAMCDPKSWAKVRSAVMRGWVKCSDGRLYHPVVAEKALTSWAAKQAQRSRTEAARQAKAAKRTGSVTETATEPVTDAVTGIATVSATDSATEVVTASKGEGEGERKRKKDPLTPTPGGAGGSRRSSIREGKEPPGRPDGWVGQWDGLRASGTSPRQVAAAEARAKPAPPEPTSPLWPVLRARGMSLADFRHWIEPLTVGEVHDGRATVQAPKRFHADHVRREWGPALEAAIGARVDLVALGAAA